MSNQFLERFIKQKKFLQNKPLELSKFIEYCEKCDIKTTPEELEYLEQHKLLLPVFRFSRPLIPASFGRQGKEYKCISFYKSEDLTPFLNDGSLFCPEDRVFISWESFKGENLHDDSRKILSYYSTFQVLWLRCIREKLFCSFELRSDQLQSLNQNRDLFLKKFYWDDDNLSECFNKLKLDSEKFTDFLKLLLLIQNVYYPYFKSCKDRISVDDHEEWRNSASLFNLDSELECLGGMDPRIILSYYHEFSVKACSFFGVKEGRTDDWLQLWQSITWAKKSDLTGPIRMGIEFLQTSKMLKRCLEDYYLGKKVPDIDEIHLRDFQNDSLNGFLEDPLSVPNRMMEIRLDRYMEKLNEKYKRAYYLSNKFGLSDHPKMMLFVEGDSEEIVLPKVFERYCGVTLENYGIQLVNLGGITKFFSGEIKTQQPGENRVRARVNNFKELISNNLEHWQILPYLLVDNENTILADLKQYDSITFCEGKYKFPEKWRYIWGVTNLHAPFVGNNIEFSNFSNEELSYVIHGDNTDTSRIEEISHVRKSKKQSLDDLKRKWDIKKSKSQILEELFDRLFENLIFDRPIFWAFDLIRNIASLNHAPVDRAIELENKKTIVNWLSE